MQGVLFVLDDSSFLRANSVFVLLRLAHSLFKAHISQAESGCARLRDGDALPSPKAMTPDMGTGLDETALR